MKLNNCLLLLSGTEQAAEMQSDSNLTVLFPQCCVISVFGSFINMFKKRNHVHKCCCRHKVKCVDSGNPDYSKDPGR